MSNTDLSHRLSGLGAGIAALTLLTLTPAVGAAQQRVVITDLPMAEQVRVRAETEARTAADAAEADRLLAEAEKADRSADFRKAAGLYERSGQLRMPSDARGTEALESAGRAHFSADRPGRASRAWEKAAARTLIRGDVYRASENYMRAALAAQDAGDRLRAADLAWKAYHLSESPQLTEAERTRLRQHIRVGGAGGLAGK